MQARSLHIYRQLFEDLRISEDGLLRLKSMNQFGEEIYRICVPFEKLSEVSFVAHHMNLAGHFSTAASWSEPSPCFTPLP